MYIDGVTTFNKDLNIVKKEEGNFVSSESLKFLRKSILVSCEIVLYIFQVWIMHTKIECEFMSIENRGSNMKRSGTSLQHFYVVKIW